MLRADVFAQRGVHPTEVVAVFLLNGRQSADVVEEIPAMDVLHSVWTARDLQGLRRNGRLSGSDVADLAHRTKRMLCWRTARSDVTGEIKQMTNMFF